MAIVKATAGAIRVAAEHLREGRLVAFPTETVYGLGGDATNGKAVAAIFEAKGRPRFNPLIVHFADISGARMHAEFTPLGLRLAEAFWPGPLTLVLKRRAESDLCDLVSAGLETLAIRAPDHPIAQALLEAAVWPLAAPSANKSGRVSPTQANHVQMDLGDRVGLILDGGPTAHGLESTIIDATGEAPILLRTGAVPAETIEVVLGQTINRAVDAGDNPLSPGQLASHYAPEAKVRLGATDVQEGEALLAFGSNVPAAAGPMINLSATGDLIEAAANLFAALRTLDQSGTKRIAVMPIPEQGLGEGINDRLRRAATPR
jgi:L-threonylcarbamoyladenylate synthase